MHILIGLAMGLALLYFWLIGHWFARVLMFLVLGAGLSLVVGALLYGIFETREHGAGGAGAVFGGGMGLTLAWFAARIPLYYWRYQIRKIELGSPGAGLRF